MKVSNPQADRAILACIVDQVTGESQWHEIPAGETVEVDDYVVASTLVEHGATATRAELEAARELWAERNRAMNSRTASASASEGAIIGRRQATVDVATGTSSTEVDALKGAALDEAVKAANEAGAEITAAKAQDKRDALAAWQKSRGSSTPVDDEFVVDEGGELVLDDDGQPIPVVKGDGDPDEQVAGGDLNVTDQLVEGAAAGDHSGQDEDTAKGQD